MLKFAWNNNDEGKINGLASLLFTLFLNPCVSMLCCLAWSESSGKILVFQIEVLVCVQGIEK